MKGSKIIIFLTIIAMIMVPITTTAIDDKVSIGTIIGSFTKTDKEIYVNDQRVQGYLVDNEIAICIEDLQYCGFAGTWDPRLRRSRFDYIGFDNYNESNREEAVNIEGNSIFGTDVEIYIDGDRVKAYAANGYSLVKISDLDEFANIEYGESISIVMNEETLNSTEIVKFDDTTLKKIIRGKLNQPYGRIYKTSLDEIEKITKDDIKEFADIDDYKVGEFSKISLVDEDDKYTDEAFLIKDLQGIEYLANLKELEFISINKTEDKEALRNLSNLKKLKLQIPPVHNLEFLKELKSLEELDISSTESVMTIGQIANLRKLSIKTEAYDLSPLSNLKNVTELSIELKRLDKPNAFDFLRDMDSLKKLKLSISPRHLINKDFDTSIFRELNQLEEFELILLRDIDFEVDKDTTTIQILDFLKDFHTLTALRIYPIRNYYSTQCELSIEGIEHLINLKELTIVSDYKLSDITPLRFSNKLKKLELKEVTIEDLEPIRNISSLEELRITSNKGSFNSFKPLEELDKLKVLELSAYEPYSPWLAEKYGLETKMPSDVSTLGKLNELESIEITGYKIDDISWIKGLNLLSTVDLSNNNIVDISPLARLKNIRAIDLSRNKVSNIVVLGDFKSLERLNLSYNNITSIEELNHKDKIIQLDTSYNNGLILPKNFNLPNVELLICRENQVYNGIFSGNMPNLKEANLSSTKLKTIRNTENMSNIERLFLTGNYITDVSFLEDIISLRDLDLSYNLIENIYPLRKLSFLEYLGIGENKIKDINPIFSLRYLKLMNIDDENKEQVLSNDSLWEELPWLDRYYINYGLVVPRYYDIASKNLEKTSTTTYKGRIYIEEGSSLPEEGLIVTVSLVTRGKYGNITENPIKKIYIPHGEESVEYEFDVQNFTPQGFTSKSIGIKIDNLRYELSTNTDFKIPVTTKNQILEDCDIEVVKRARIKGKLMLDDKILDLGPEDEYFKTREIAIYARINDEIRTFVVTAELKDKEVKYELYIPKNLAGNEIVLEYAIRDWGVFGFVTHYGKAGDIIIKEFLTDDYTLSPNIDKSKRIMFGGKDMVVEDVYVEY